MDEGGGTIWLIRRKDKEGGPGYFSVAGREEEEELKEIKEVGEGEGNGGEVKEKENESLIRLYYYFL